MRSLFLGSSHVNHLEGYLRKYGLQTFNLDDSHRVKTYGISGGCVYNASHLQRLEAKIDEFRPHQAILQLGGNDLDQENLTTADADEIVMRLVSLVSLWTNRYRIRDFVILQFMFRRKTRNIPVQIYNDVVLYANTKLKEELSTYPNLRYWNIKGIKYPSEPIYFDGVHFNDYGLAKYYKNVRGAIITGQ